MICTAECSLPGTVHGELIANSYLIKHFIDQIASLPQPLVLYLLANHPAQSLIQQQGSKFAMIFNGVTDAALALYVNMTMFASSRNVPELTHSGSTSLLPFKTPNCEPTLNYRDFSKSYLD